MSVKFEGTVLKVGNSLRITIPEEIANQLNLERGDAVELWVSNHSMLMEKKTLIYDAIWGFEEDILEERKSLTKEIESHTSQSVGGLPLHKYKGQLSIEGDKIMLKGENADSREPKFSIFSQRSGKYFLRVGRNPEKMERHKSIDSPAENHFQR